jgi:endonuclease/exonuclease/phosphatase family metal-dependent hydrolase
VPLLQDQQWPGMHRNRRNCVPEMWRINIQRLVALAAVLFFGSQGIAIAETIRVTTWNLQWFPSGVPDVILPEVEARRIQEAAQTIAVLNPDVLLLQEVRDWESCQKLAEAIKASAGLEYHVTVCSAFKDPVGQMVGWQQVAILSKSSAQAAWASPWTTKGILDPPRGYAFAVFHFGQADVGFYSVHLKSNLVRGNDEKTKQINILKRELSAEQVVARSGEASKDFPQIKGFVVAGDLNTNRDEFVSERTLGIFETAGFNDPFAILPLASRVTHPAKGRYPDTTFDYVLAKGLRHLGTPEILKSKVSDHLPVTCELELP